MRYDLTDLRLFVAIADAANISRGAQSCHLAPSSASLRLRHLEETIGTPLFKRRARGVELTTAGLVMLDHARRCLWQLEEMHAALAPYARGVRGQLTVLANSNAIASFLPDDVQGFLFAHPSVRVLLEERLSHEIVQCVADGRADVGVTAWPGQHHGVVFLPYREDRLVVITTRPHPWSRRRHISFAECLDQPFVTMRGDSAIQTFLFERAHDLGRRLDTRIQVSSLQAVVSLVRSGAGIGIVPRTILDSVDASAIHELALEEDWAMRSLRVCMPADRARASIYAQALARHLSPA
ncbi:MAG: LysR family transcriptional regulator [Burkholderiaceae bacterium]